MQFGSQVATDKILITWILGGQVCIDTLGDHTVDRVSILKWNLGKYWELCLVFPKRIPKRHNNTSHICLKYGLILVLWEQDHSWLFLIKGCYAIL